jgi:hypothetical protein
MALAVGRFWCIISRIFILELLLGIAGLFKPKYRVIVIVSVQGRKCNSCSCHRDLDYSTKYW